jgi:hypothetical protein
MASLKVGLFADLLKPDELRAIEEGYRRTTHIATSAVDQQERDRIARFGELGNTGLILPFSRSCSTAALVALEILTSRTACAPMVRKAGQAARFWVLTTNLNRGSRDSLALGRPSVWFARTDSRTPRAFSSRLAGA